jgi:acetylornithine/succinyldiaminopimelate/putrescine aminotransferase
LLIADEVMSGFGRTGEWFAVNHWNAVPDMITMAKGITSGYLPLGAVVVSDRIASFFEEHTFWGGLTYSGHPMSGAAGIATLRACQEDRLLDNTKQMELVMASALSLGCSAFAFSPQIGYNGSDLYAGPSAQARNCNSKGSWAVYRRRPSGMQGRHSMAAWLPSSRPA